MQAPSDFTDYQAESATISQGVVDTKHAGYTGSGFVDYANVAGSYVEFTVSAAAAGQQALAFRYANGTTTNRPLDISVNGTVVARDFPRHRRVDHLAGGHRQRDAERGRERRQGHRRHRERRAQPRQAARQRPRRHRESPPRQDSRRAARSHTTASS
ncbi:CBM35 domain-containing protein [Nonomuraea dietziae]|uniref:CBM35 domain-containing protein n=1 Tax=Nonomuraea dietziae TaxID=65515 RepID=UPI0031DEB447